jgi:hypothetical protein
MIFQVSAKGTPREVGRAIGESLRQEIASCLAPSPGRQRDLATSEAKVRRISTIPSATTGMCLCLPSPLYASGFLPCS